MKIIKSFTAYYKFLFMFFLAISVYSQQAIFFERYLIDDGEVQLNSKLIEKSKIMKKIADDCDNIQYSDIVSYLNWLSLIPFHFGSMSNSNILEDSCIYYEIYDKTTHNIPFRKFNGKKIFFFPISYLENKGNISDSLSLLNYSLTPSSLEIQLANETIVFDHFIDDSLKEYSFGKIIHTRRIDEVSILGRNFFELSEYFILIRQNSESCDLHVVWLDKNFDVRYIEKNISVGYLYLE